MSSLRSQMALVMVPDCLTVAISPRVVQSQAAALAREVRQQDQKETRAVRFAAGSTSPANWAALAQLFRQAGDDVDLQALLREYLTLAFKDNFIPPRGVGYEVTHLCSARFATPPDPLTNDNVAVEWQAFVSAWRQYTAAQKEDLPSTRLFAQVAAAIDAWEEAGPPDDECRRYLVRLRRAVDNPNIVSVFVHGGCHILNLHGTVHDLGLYVIAHRFAVRAGSAASHILTKLCHTLIRVSRFRFEQQLEEKLQLAEMRAGQSRQRRLATTRADNIRRQRFYTNMTEFIRTRVWVLPPVDLSRSTSSGRYTTHRRYRTYYYSY